MFPTRFVCLLLCAVCVMGLCLGVSAAEVESGSVYCFSGEEFTGGKEETLAGVCIMDLPDSQAGTVFLGSRVLRRGDILTAEQLSMLTFCPLQTEQDTSAAVTYLPIYHDRVEPSATVTISIRGRKNEAPVAEDMALETYKNLPNEGLLKATDPEGEGLTYTVTRQPRRGEVTVNADGSFVYKPKKNKVGVDSFTYTATDPAGNVSREATVTIQILKPSDKKQYADTVGRDCRFAAEWMRHTGLFAGETINSETCFQPDKPVSRGEFVAMLVNLLQIPADSDAQTTLAQDTPAWLRPYLNAAIRSGLIAGTGAAQSGSFDAAAAIGCEEAAVMLQNVLDLDVPAMTEEEGGQTLLQVMADYGFDLTGGQTLTRGQAAKVLYQVYRLAADAPGMLVLRLQQ